MSFMISSLYEHIYSCSWSNMDIVPVLFVIVVCVGGTVPPQYVALNE